MSTRAWPMIRQRARSIRPFLKFCLLAALFWLTVVSCLVSLIPILPEVPLASPPAIYEQVKTEYVGREPITNYKKTTRGHGFDQAVVDAVSAVTIRIRVEYPEDTSWRRLRGGHLYA